MKIKVEGDGGKGWDIAFLDIDSGKFLPVASNEPKSFSPTEQGIIATVSLLLDQSHKETMRLSAIGEGSKITIINDESGEVLPLIGNNDVIVLKDCAMVKCSFLVDSFGVNHHTGSIVEMREKFGDILQ